jgi:hypothetical protein
MGEHTKLFERAAARFELPDLPMERLLRRRDRKQRNQRIAAFVVAISVLAVPAAVVATSRTAERTPTPGETGSSPSPTDAAPVAEAHQPDPGLARVNVMELPPEGAAPSSPARGELLLAADGRGQASRRLLTHIYLYADGRLIWWREGDLPEGASAHEILEQRLTPEGAELLRSEAASSGLFDRDLVFMGGEADPDPLAFWGGMRARNGRRLIELQLGWTHVGPAEDYEGDTIMTAEQERALEVLDARLADPAAWLPASAWVDEHVGTYVPPAYRVCYGGSRESMEPESILDALPGPAQNLLRARDVKDMRVPAYAYPVRVVFSCSDVSIEGARVVVGALAEAGFEREERPTYASDDPFIAGGYASATFEYLFPVEGQAQEAALWIDPYLPHGEAPCLPCG